jgi:hypothetical protein
MYLKTGYVTLFVEVQNGYDHPSDMEDLAKCISEMGDRQENGPDSTEAEGFLSMAFENGFDGISSDESFYSEVVKNLSLDYPRLIFALDSKHVDPFTVLWRKYFKNGKVQLVIPYQVIPDFAPSEAVSVDY